MNNSSINPLLTLMLVSAAMLTACGSGVTVTPPAPVLLKAAGSTSTQPLFSALAAAFNQQNPHITFDVQGGGSQLGERLVRAGQVDFGLVSWPPQNPDETLRFTPLGRDAIAIILHPNNRVAGVSMVELRNIFSGKMLDWRAVEGTNLPVQVVSREDGSGTRAAFETIVMNGQAVTPNAIVLPNSRAVVDFVAKTPNAVGYVSLGLVDNRVYAVSVEGVTPGLDSLNNGSYPMLRDLAVVVGPENRPEATQFLRFAQSPAGQQVISTHWGRVQ